MKADNKNTLIKKSCLFERIKQVFNAYIKGFEPSKPKKYQTYIFITFAIEFIVWFLLMFLFIFATNQMNFNNDELPTKFKIYYNFCQSTYDFIQLIDIVLLITCIFYFIRLKGHFNTCVLNSFGIRYQKIIKPIIIFVCIFAILNTFLLRPVSTMLNNSYITEKKHQIKKIVNGEDVAISDKNEKQNLYINAKFVEKSDDVVLLSNVVAVQYDKKEPKRVLVAQKLYLKDQQWKFKNVDEIIYKDPLNYRGRTEKQIEYIEQYGLNFNHENTHLETIIITSKLTVDALMTTLKNKNKIDKSLDLTIYDSIRALYLDTSFVEAEEHNLARANVISAIILFFNMLSCCFISMIICINNNRNTNVLKTGLCCFLSYIVLTRFFKFLEPFAQQGALKSCIVVVLSISICIISQILLIQKEWNNIVVNYIRNDVSLLFSKIKSIIKK